MMAAEHASAGSDAAGHQPGGIILPGMAPPSARRAVERSGTYPGRPSAREVAAAGRQPGPPPRGTGAALARLAMPLADVAGLAAAAVITAVGGGGPGLLPCAVFAGAVVVIPTAGGLHRLRICLRVSDQAGRILAATAVSALALAPWLPAMTLGRLCLMAPLLLFLIALVRLRTGQAALFGQARVTGNGRVVQIMKLRTLNDHGDPDTR